MRGTAYREYHIPSRPAYCKRPLNALVLSRANSNLHEISKCVAALMIYKYGDVKFTEKIIKAIRALANEIDSTMKEFGDEANFISECIPNRAPHRRIDVVDVDRDIRYELETDHKVIKEDERENGVTIKIDI